MRTLMPAFRHSFSGGDDFIIPVPDLESLSPDVLASECDEIMITQHIDFEGTFSALESIKTYAHATKIVDLNVPQLSSNSSSIFSGPSITFESAEIDSQKTK